MSFVKFVNKDNVTNKKFEIYQSDLGEKAPQIVLKKFYSLELKQIPKKKDQKTPDYEIVDRDGNLIAICEVKTCIDTPQLEDLNIEIPYERLAEISKKRDKNHRSKLEKHHNKAILQLADYSSLPTLLIFVSFDMTDYIDMGMMLQEYKELYPSIQMADVYVLMKVHQNIIYSDTFEIKETIQVMNNTSRGEDFAGKHLALLPAFQNAGNLPLTFEV